MNDELLFSTRYKREIYRNINSEIFLKGKKRNKIPNVKYFLYFCGFLVEF